MNLLDTLDLRARVSHALRCFGQELAGGYAPMDAALILTRRGEVYVGPSPALTRDPEAAGWVGLGLEFEPGPLAPDGPQAEANFVRFDEWRVSLEEWELARDLTAHAQRLAAGDGTELCAACGARVHVLAVTPEPDEEGTWAAIAEEHEAGCVWVLSRSGHRDLRAEWQVTREELGRRLWEAGWRVSGADLVTPAGELLAYQERAWVAPDGTETERGNPRAKHLEGSWLRDLLRGGDPQ